MTPGEITATVCGILPSLAVFILQLRHGWAQKQTAAKVEQHAKDIGEIKNVVIAHSNQIENLKKHTKCPDAPAAHGAHHAISRAMEIQDRDHAKHNTHK